MNILITGGAGYIGSALTEYLLRDGHKVVCYDNLMYDSASMLRYTNNPNFSFVKGDVRNVKLLQKFTSKADIIIPLAASCLYVKSTLFSPLCSVIALPVIALSKNLDTTLSGISPGPNTPLGLTIV